jgi:hypothetical protein
MTTATEKMMKAIEAELSFIRRQAVSGDAESGQLIEMSAESSAQTLFELRLELQPETDADEFDYPAPREEDSPVIVSRPVTLDAEEMMYAPRQLEAGRVGAFLI